MSTPTTPDPTAPRGAYVACGWSVYNWLLDDEPYLCDEPAVETFVFGCVHEHLSPPALTCEDCAPRVQKQDLRCTPCRDAGHPDVAVVVVERRVLATVASDDLPSSGEADR